MRCLLFLALALTLTACQDDSAADAKFQEVRLDEKTSNADIIRNPVSADGTMDTSKLAKIEFEELVFDFGEVPEGSIVRHRYKFKNTGSNALLITSAAGSCGCTVPTWPKNAIQPGGSGEIVVSFDSNNRKSKQNKVITVVANTNPQTTKLGLSGTVLENPNKTNNAPIIEK